MTDTRGSEGTRQERKARTRQAILASALELSADGGLSAVSLRQVAKHVGIVPTAFYRHFESVEQLGLVLVDESFVSLRAMLSDVRRQGTLKGVNKGSVRVLAEHTARQKAHFEFIARERYSGPRSVRQAIRHELELCQRELATDVARIPGTDMWSTEDLMLLADIIVNQMVVTAERMVTASTRPDTEEDITRTAERQLSMLMVGWSHWYSYDADGLPSRAPDTDGAAGIATSEDSEATEPIAP